jgi:oxygen-independent coproporphyrinogen-3 oxidase
MKGMMCDGEGLEHLRVDGESERLNHMASLYLHIPFCEKKCLYCDFYSIENVSPMEEFLKALHCEIELYAPYAARASFETIFFGGGTPSLLSPQQLEGIISHLTKRFPITADAEMTVETNPGTVNREKLAAFRSLGVNRLSIGIQSFREADLRFLSRIHDAKQAVECVECARAVGFDNLSIDLIYALPDQSKQEWEGNLRQALALQPNHISAYGLIVEDNTPLARMVSAKLVTPKPVEEEAEFFEFTMAFLEAQGFEHYEVSNYAQPNFRSRHNYNYWRHENYLGFGPSAHSFWKNGTARRWANKANLSHYCASLSQGQVPLALDETLTVEQLMIEKLFLGLRSDGINLNEVDRSQLDFSLIDELRAAGLATFDGTTLRLSRSGYLLCDEIAARLLTLDGKEKAPFSLKLHAAGHAVPSIPSTIGTA